MSGSVCSLGARVSTKEAAELWRKTLEVLRSIMINRDRLGEMERMISQVTGDMAEASRRGILNNPGDTYEQLHVLARLSSTIEHLRREMEELEKVEKKMQAVQKRIEMDSMIMNQIREQLRKKLQIVVKEKSDF